MNNLVEQLFKFLREMTCHAVTTEDEPWSDLNMTLRASTVYPMAIQNVRVLLQVLIEVWTASSYMEYSTCVMQCSF